MSKEKGNWNGSISMLVMKLLEEQDMYGYQMIEELAKRSDSTFQLKTGTLYPLLHSLERDGFVDSYENAEDGARMRKYYCLTEKGRKQLKDRRKEWSVYSRAVNKILGGGEGYAAV